MKRDEASELLKVALGNQQTITIKKLRNILTSMNVSLSTPEPNGETTYLKNELVKLREENKQLKRKIRHQRKEITGKSGDNEQGH